MSEYPEKQNPRSTPQRLLWVGVILKKLKSGHVCGAGLMAIHGLWHLRTPRSAPRVTKSHEGLSLETSVRRV